MKWFLALLLASIPAFSQTAPPRSVTASLLDSSGNPLSTTTDGPADSLDCHVTNLLASPVLETPVVGGVAVDPRQTRQLTTADQLLCGQLGSWSVLNITGTVSLPTGASTSALQTAGNASLTDIDSKLTTTANGLAVDGSAVTQPVSAASLPLPTGASTSANQSTANSTLSTINSTLLTSLPRDMNDGFGNKLSSASGSLDVDVTNTVPVSGTFWQATQPVSGTISATQSGIWSVRGQDGSGNLFTSQANGSQRAQDMGIDVDGVQVDPRQTRALTSADIVTAAQGGAWNITNISGTVSLPTGAATQSTLSDMDSKLATLGQKASAGSMPVVIASDQSPIPVSGSFVASNSSVGTIGSTVPTSATTVGGKDPSGNLRAFNVDSSDTLLVDGSTVTQPVSAVSLPLPSGAATSASQSAGNSTLSEINTAVQTSQPRKLQDGSGNSIDSTSGSLNVDVTNTVPIQGGNSTAVKVDGSAVTQPVSAASLPLPTGASTSANQATANSTLTTINNSITALEPREMFDGTGHALSSTAGSLNVDVTNVVPIQGGNATAVKVDGSTVTQPISGTVAATESGTWNVNAVQSGTWNLNNVSGTISLPTGASTSALQTAGNSTLSAISGQLPASIGQKTSANSLPVVIASDQMISISTANLGNTGSTVPVQAAYVGGKNGSGDLQGLAADTAGSLQVAGEGVSGTPAGGVVSVQGVSGGTNLNVDVTNTVPVSQSGAWTVGLPAGASTSALQSAGNSTLATISGTQLPAALGQTTMSASLPVTLSSNQSALAVSQSGTWNLNNISGTVSLPTNAAKETGGNLATISSNVASINGYLENTTGSSTGGVAGTQSSLFGGIYNSTPLSLTNGQQAALQFDSSGHIMVDATNPSVSATGSSPPADATLAGVLSSTGTMAALNLDPSGALKVDGSGSTQPVSGTITADQGGTWNLNNISGSISLPTGAATSADQLTGNSTLTTISGKLPTTLGANATANSLSVNIASDQTVPVSGTFWQTTQPISGTVTANAGTGTFAISAASLPLPTGASTSAKQPALGTAGSASSDVVTVQGIASMTPLLVDGSGVTQPVSGTVTADQGGTWNLNNVSGTVSLPTGASTSALQTAGNVSLSTISGQLPTTLGQKNSANSEAVVLASDQPAIPVSQSGSWSTGRTWSLSGSSDVVKSQLQDNAGNGVTSTLIGGIHQAVDVNAVGVTTAAVADIMTSGTITTICLTPTTSCPTGSFVTGSINGVATTRMQVSGSFTGASITVYGTVDGSNWLILETAVGPTGTYTTDSITSTGEYRLFRIAGFTQLRVVATALSTGSVSIIFNNSIGSNLIETVQQNPANFLTTSWLNDGSGNSINSTSGSLNIDVTNTVPVSQSGAWNITNVSGTVSLPTNAAQETGGNLATIASNTSNTNTSIQNVQGSATGGAAGSKSGLIGAQYNSSFPTLTAGQQSAVQSDSSGRLLVGSIASALPAGSNTLGAVTQASGPWTNNITQFGSSAVVTGTGAGGVGIPRVTVSNDSNILATQSGTWNITNITGTVSLPTGAATSANQTAVTGSASGGTAATSALLTGGEYNSVLPALTTGQQAALQLDASGREMISPLTNTSVVKAQLQDNSGSGITLGQKTMSSSVPVAIASDQSAIPASQSGNWSMRLQDGAGNVITSQSNGGQRPLDVGVNVAGVQVDPRTRTWDLASGTDSVSSVQSGTWTVQQGTGPWTQNLTQVGGSAIALGQTSASASLPVVTQSDATPVTQSITAQDIVTTTTSGANSQSIFTGSPTAGSAASFSLSSWEGLQVQVTGTWTGTLSSELSFDGGTTWYLRGLKQAGVGYTANSFTANFGAAANVAGATNYRVRSTAAWTGTATVKITQTTHDFVVSVENAVLLKDGTNQSNVNTIKAASTAASTTDTALVVAVSPNNTVAVTQSTSPWVDNITQFGGSNVATGTGASGSGIPRVTVSNDSNVLATQSGTWTVAQGTAAGLSGHWPVQITDGTNTMPTMDSAARAGFQKVTDGTNVAAVKAASTAAAAGDPSLVVALSPNSPLPAGSAVIGALSANQSINVAQIAGTATVTAGVSGLQAVGGNAASGASDAGNPVKVGGVHNTTLPTIANGDRSDLQVDAAGRLITAAQGSTGATVPTAAVLTGGSDGTNIQAIGVQTETTNSPSSSYFIQTVPMAFSYKNLTGAATTTVKSGAGTLHEFCINDNDLSMSATIYDNTAGSGTIIATLTNTLGGGTSQPNVCVLHDIAFSTGLTVVTTGTTANYTAIYK